MGPRPSSSTTTGSLTAVSIGFLHFPSTPLPALRKVSFLLAVVARSLAPFGSHSFLEAWLLSFRSSRRKTLQVVVPQATYVACARTPASPVGLDEDARRYDANTAWQKRNERQRAPVSLSFVSAPNSQLMKRSTSLSCWYSPTFDDVSDNRAPHED